MSKSVASGRRGPGVFRAIVKVSLGCVLLGGCSTGSERFGSLEFGSGYQAAPPPSQVSRAALNAPSSYAAQQSPQYANSQYPAGRQPASYQQTASYQPPQGGGYRLASAAPNQGAGYLQVSRVDLPPLQQPQQAPARASGVRTADGYGRYGPPPLADGEYSGPRIYTPYDSPRDYAPPPPPPDVERRLDRDVPPPPPPSDFYRRSENDAPPPPEYRDRPRYRDEERRDRERYGFYGRQRSSASLGGAEIKKPNDTVAADRGEGKTVTVKRGDTLYSLATKHGVTIDMIARANGLSNRFYVKPGTELLIPQAGPTKFGQAQGETPKAQAAGCTGDQCYTVKKGETVASIARAHRVTEAQILQANNLPDARSLKAGQAIAIPGREAPGQAAVAEAVPQPRAPAPAPAPEPQAPALAPVPSGGTLKAPEPLKPAPEAKPVSIKPAEPACDAALANPLPRMGKNFRKPVEGLIIGQFGPQRDGSVNEGVTMSVPKGTPIKAAENGVVAYVGDELPGFGNLILIRHADEYVTAYAHADEILVKKCDVVKRGQVVAKAGATGDASQPQLHFEIRKNAKPVDPAPLLGS
jgi:murein DD-endopeptidase MepM/ murein hydrolase activator NlpD